MKYRLKYREHLHEFLTTFTEKERERTVTRYSDLVVSHKAFPSEFTRCFATLMRVLGTRRNFETLLATVGGRRKTWNMRDT